MISDAELLDAWRRGDRTSGRMLFERYYEAIERFFANKLSSDIEDLVQETFVACVESSHRIVEGHKFRSFLFSIAYNVLRNYFRSKRRKGESVDFDQISVCDIAPGPGTISSKRREQQLLIDGLRSIPLNHQVLLELHYWEDMTTGAIAEILDMPVGTVRSRLRRARELLEEAMVRLSPSRDSNLSFASEIDRWAAECKQFLP